MIPHAPTLGIATRQIDWGTVAPWGIYPLSVLAWGLCGWGVWMRWRRWQRGQPLGENRLRPFWPRLGWALRDSFVVWRLWRKPVAGLLHVAVIWGMIVLFLASFVDFLQHDVHWRIAQGPFYLYFQSLTVNMVGGAAALAVVIWMARRLGFAPQRIRSPAPWDRSGVVLINLFWLFAILGTGYFLSATRIAATHDPWGRYRPLAEALVQGLALQRVSYTTLLAWHEALWWGHAALAMGWVAALPFWRWNGLHWFTGLMNNYLRRWDSAEPVVHRLDFERASVLGVRTVRDFSWKALLDLDACTECGLCQEACPAWQTGKALSPKAVVLGLRAIAQRDGAPGADADSPEVSSVLTPDVLWSCTTCRACAEVCPVSVEPFPKLLEVRRYAAMEAADVPESVAVALQSLAERGHPFAGTRSSRTDWCQDLKVPVVEGRIPEGHWLFWVGCNGALNPRQQRVVRATAEIFLRAQLPFAILGEAERCTGDPARRVGHEWIFDQLARANVEQLNRLGVERIVTTCPHCLQVLRNEYPEYGGHYVVLHHSELLAELVENGRLMLQPGEERSMTYHDPCYLGRYNRIFDAPRLVIQRAGVLREMPRAREQSFCCGAGGGLFWMEDRQGERINRQRAAEALATQADILTVSCPFCLGMLEDGVRGLRMDDTVIPVLDVAEVVAQSLVDE